MSTPLSAAEEPLAEVPGLRALGWGLLMEPVTLHHRLVLAGVGSPAAHAPWLLMGSPAGRVLVARLHLLLLAVGPALALGLAIAGALVGWTLPRGMVLGLISFNTAVALVLAWTSGLAAGTLQGLLMPPASVLALALVLHGPALTGLILSLGVPVGLVVGASASFRRGEALPVRGPLLLSLGVGVVVALVGRYVGSPRMPLLVLGGSAAFCAGLMRLPVYALEVPAQLVLFALERLQLARTLHLVPVLHHDLSYLPHPLLVSHVQRAARQDPELARRVTAACFIAPGQRGSGRLLQKALGERPTLVDKHSGSVRLG